MMNARDSVDRDERTEAVENEAHRLAYTLLTFALLMDVVYRGYVRNEAAWDLLGMVIGGGLFCAIYQAGKKAMPQIWVWTTVISTVMAAVVASALTFYFYRA